jgi:hypothetical protein
MSYSVTQSKKGARSLLFSRIINSSGKKEQLDDVIRMFFYHRFVRKQVFHFGPRTLKPQVTRSWNKQNLSLPLFMPKSEKNSPFFSLALECRRPISSITSKVYFAPYNWQSRATIRNNRFMAKLSGETTTTGMHQTSDEESNESVNDERAGGKDDGLKPGFEGLPDKQLSTTEEEYAVPTPAVPQ